MTRTSRFQKPRARRGSNVDVPRLLASLGIEVAKREGKSLYALCPGHADNSPDTWSIVDDPRDPKKNGWHYCFSCEFGGGPLKLAMEVRGCSSEEAAKFLDELPAHDGPLEVQLEVSEYKPRASEQFEIPSECRMDVPLDDWPMPALSYLSERGVDGRQLRAYRLGYCVAGRLAGRVVFPMLDKIGEETIAQSYTARDFTGQQRKRYKEPQSSEGAKKDALFGAHLMLRDSPVVVVAEGPFDVLAIERTVRSFVDVVSLHGSHLYPSQAVRLSRYPAIVVATDNDNAGNRVAEEIAGALGRYTFIRRLLVPEGEDCASLPPSELRSLFAELDLV